MVAFSENLIKLHYNIRKSVVKGFYRKEILWIFAQPPNVVQCFDWKIGLRPALAKKISYDIITKNPTAARAVFMF